MKETTKLLLVDDESQFVDILARRLALRGFDTRVVHTGEAALKAVTEATDAMILDLRMSGMDGFEVMQAVRVSHPEIRIIILTGYGGDTEEQTAYRMGADAFLRKPVEIDELIQCIDLAVGEKETEKAKKAHLPR